MIMHARRSGGGAQGGRDVVVIAAFLGPQQEYLPLKTGQSRQAGPQPILRFSGGEIRMGIGPVRQVAVVDATPPAAPSAADTRPCAGCPRS